MKKKFIIVVIIFVIISCGKDKHHSQSDNDSSYDYDYITDISTLTELNAVVDNSFLPYDTHESLGVLFAAKQKTYNLEVMTCTWFLIDNQHAMTNSHCIPGYLKNSTTDCQYGLIGLFNTKNGPVKRHCQKIVTVSQIDDSNYNKTDYAIIKLNSPISTLDAKPFEISRNGISNNEIVRIYAMNMRNHDYNSNFGYMTKHRCIAKHGLVFGNFTDQRSTIVPIFKQTGTNDKCHVVHGNSGSPVLDKEGKVVAVVFSTKDETKERKIDQFALITNLSCLKTNIPELDHNIDKDCHNFLVNEKKLFERKKVEFKNKKTNKMTKLLNKKLTALPSVFQYDFKNHTVTDKEINLRVQVKCVNKIKDWKKVDFEQIFEEGIPFFKVKKYRMHLPLYKIHLKHSVGAYGSLEIKWHIEDISSMKLTLNIDALEKGEKTPGKIESTILNQDILMPLTISWCD